ncbi:MAG: hypothetical protein QGI33_01510 [Candidatus Brocadiia bacterium]|jgi:predicted transcriptional regulator|nr:hypothetical protein [Candidatus Brocadiia bacterium]
MANHWQTNLSRRERQIMEIIYRMGRASVAEAPRQLKALEKENARLKRLVADQALDMQILKEAARPNL